MLDAWQRRLHVLRRGSLGIATMARTFWLATTVVALLVSTPAVRAGEALADELARAAPESDPAVLALAATALDCATAAAPAPPQRLAVVDYSRASTRVRLWVFDLATHRLLHAERVAHGRGSGDDFATKFSNDSGSHRSSIGLFRTAETYFGQNGYSLRMDGLEAGVNDRAWDRAIVMHGAD